MSKNVSANTLFHFTSDRNALLNILKNGLYVRYSLEDYSELVDGSSELVLPMTCFCDIPLGSVEKHARTYGKYAIGLSKNWGMKNGISPVIYAYPNSPTAKIIDTLYNELMQMLTNFDADHYKDVNFEPILDRIKFQDKGAELEIKEKVKKMQHGIFDFMRYIKPYQGKVKSHGDAVAKVVNFYEEREWRYTPSIAKYKEIINSRIPLRSPLFTSLPKMSYKPEFYKEPIKRRAINMKLAPYIKLTFAPSDIRFIILSKENEIPNFLKDMNRIAWEKTSEEQLKILGTRLISLEQINEDL